ncbi:MAG: DapH/DapD/GlmU-related protein [Sedimentisphaerales bacterium]
MSDIILFLYHVAMRLRRWHIPLLPVFIQYAIRLGCACHIGLGARIGKHTHLAYGGLGTVIHPTAVIGRNVYIGTHVTIGGRSGHSSAPTIGDNCFIGTGASVLGHITVGRDCVIGANAVVVDDLPARCCAAGVPSKVFRTDIDLAEYRTRHDMQFYVPLDQDQADLAEESAGHSQLPKTSQGYLWPRSP